MIMSGSCTRHRAKPSARSGVSYGFAAALTSAAAS
jgi:hypothetical protein